ncbi:hypothetical protein B0H19DRAFT_957043, partial [Mycena capillaripes]
VPGPQVTESLLNACATFFPSNYGVWSSSVSTPLRPNAPVKMSAVKLRAQCLSDPERSMLALCTTGDKDILGYAFASVWTCEGSEICWITQLVVSREHRRRAIATILLQLLPGPEFDCAAFGLVSSHPAACLALLKRTRWFIRLSPLDVNFIKANAQRILDTSSVSYLKDGQLRGSLWQEAAEAGVVSCLFTDFHVDHTEPLRAQKSWEDSQDLRWPLGALPEGHEFFCISPTKYLAVNCTTQFGDRPSV